MSKQRSMKSLVFVVVLLLLSACLAFAAEAKKDKEQGVKKTNDNDVYRPFLINNVFNYYGNNGDGSYNKFSSDNEGFEFPKGSGKHVIFEDGIVWGGYHKGRAIPKVGGSVYRHGLQAGIITSNGTATTDPTADNPALTKYRVYRVRPDINPKTTLDEALTTKITTQELDLINRYESYSAADIYGQYIQDWNEWPADLGAPFTYGKDAAGNQRTSGPYDPNFDIPGVKGADQTLWYTANDMSTSRTTGLSGSPPIGLEMHRTIWGYNRAGALGNTIFASTIIINKSGARIDTTYFVQWSDPDLGDAGDDFDGCDTSRSLGYIYNGGASDATYGVAVPAGGFTFFQGPIVPGAPTDSAVFQLKYRHGFKNLKMSAFVIFVNGSTTYGDPLQGSGGDIQWYHLMKGTIASSGSPFINPITTQPTVFVFGGGDPVAGTGWNDGPPIGPPGDRRLCMVTGPFTMAPGDTQELVVANLAGLGGDRLSSISVLRGISDKAQSAYNNLFVLPGPPPVPNVTVTQLNNEIVLNWGAEADVEKTEGTVDQGYTFEGYNVYELSGPTFQNPILLGTFDLNDGVTVIDDTVFDATVGLFFPTVLQKGNDKGIIHSMNITNSKVTGAGLVNFTKYYFAVTAYSYNANPPAAAGTHSLESPAEVKTVIPQPPGPGSRLTQSYGDTLHVTLATAPGGSPSDGSVVPLVVDPTKLTGDTYNVKFKVDTTSGNTLWYLSDVTKGTKLIDNQSNQTGDESYLQVDGLSVKVIGPPPGVKDYAVIGTRNLTWAGGEGFALEGFNGAIGWGGGWWTQVFAAGSDVTADKVHNISIHEAATDANGVFNASDTLVSYGYRYLRGATAAAAKPEFAPFIIHATAGYAWQAYEKNVPLAVYDDETHTRLAVGFMENNQPGGTVDGRYWPPLTGASNTDAGGPREWFWVFNTPYTGATENPALEKDILNNVLPIMYFITWDRRDALGWTTSQGLQVLANHVNSVYHTFTFTATKPTVTDQALATKDVGNVNVFPNPYLGFNSQESNKYNRFVTFTHLPAKATIRIFNLAGVLMRTIIKNDQLQTIQWDLKNESGFPASAGMYVVYIDMPDLGVTKTLKLGIIPEQQYIDRW